MKQQLVEPENEINLIHKILGGEIDLFELLIRRYNPTLYKTGRSYRYNHEDTQDLMQETFINAYMNLDKFENRSTFKTWVTKIMLNNCYQKQRKFAYKNEIAMELNDKSTPLFTDNTNTDTNKVNYQREMGSVIENALQNVSEDYRMVFSLREINGFNVAETADILNISESNVKVRLNRTKALLRKEIEKSYSYEEIFEFNLIYCDAIVHNVMSHIRKLI
ncbi:MAG: sigma-70 family RNA polymerase sigma factor [Crocinitomicaceae bacterium]